MLLLKDFSYLFLCVCVRAKVTLKALKKHQSSGGGRAGSSLPVPHSPPWVKRPAVPCPGLAARRLPRRQAPRRREGRSTSQEQAQRFLGGRRLPGRADPLVRTASGASQPPPLVMLSLPIAFSTKLRYMMFMRFLEGKLNG